MDHEPLPEPTDDKVVSPLLGSYLVRVHLRGEGEEPTLSRIEGAIEEALASFGEGAYTASVHAERID